MKHPPANLELAETDDYKVLRDPDNPTTVYVIEPPFEGQVDVYHDHQHCGAGVNNLQIQAYGTTLDLEFCASEEWEYWPL